MSRNKPTLTKLSLILIIILLMTLSLLTSFVMIKGSGLTTSVKNIFLLSILMIVFNSSKKAFLYILIPMGIIYTVYAPIGITFGPPSYQYLSSVIATDLLEGTEFFSQIPTFNYFIAISIIPLLSLYRYISIKYNIKPYKNKTILCVFIFMSLINQSPTEFFRKAYSSTMAVYSDYKEISKMSKKSEWGDSHISDKSTYDNYIIIIGESARRDYHHAYGYPVNNTPFISNSNSFVVDGLMAGGTNTVSSLRLMLTKPNKQSKEPNYSLNFIDMAKSADIETYWFSNQGVISSVDTPIAAIANRSDHKFFLKYGDYKSKNTSDFELIGLLKKTLLNKKHNRGKSLYVLHLYGSHPNACDRISDYNIKYRNDNYKYISCYVSSINKTDDIIRETLNIFEENKEKTNESYSILYFSDHGLSHNIVDGEIILNHADSGKYHHDIPLFMINSDSVNKIKCKSFKSALNFTEGLGNWIGISNKNIDIKYNLFNCVSDDDFGLFNALERVTKNDPAISIIK